MGEILTQAQYDELLSSEAQAAGDTDLRVELAEIRVIGRYREEREGALTWYYEGKVDPTLNVRLFGFREAEDGTIDLEASSQELVRSLRLVISSIVNWRYRQEETQMIDRERVGQKAVAYGDVEEVPSRLFQPLDEYDERQPFSGF